MRQAIFLLAFTTLAVPAPATDTPEARSILNMVAQAAQSGRSYRAEFKTSVDTKSNGMQQKIDMTGTILFQPPGKMRMDMNMGPMQMLMVSDGKQGWSYLPSLKQYMKLPAGSASAAGVPGMSDILGSGVNAGVESAQLVREEPVTFDGAPVACYVISAEYAPSAAMKKKSSTLWIDKVKYMVLRRQDATQVEAPQVPGPIEANTDFSLTKITWGPETKPEDFQFTPPGDATEMKLPQMTAPAAAK